MAQEQNSGDCNMSITKSAIFLIKIPKYIAQRFEKAEDNVEVGKFCLKGTRVKPSMSLVLSDSILKDETGTIPKMYDLPMKDNLVQSSTIFSKSPQKSHAIEGYVTHRLYCKPSQEKSSAPHTLADIKNRKNPVRQIVYINEVVQDDISLGSHRQNENNERINKVESKNLRIDRDKVAKLLFRSFERHQYYQFKDLVKITKQPVVYLKEILKEYCIYNVLPPNKCMWELKPEYCHYKNKNSKK